MAGTTTPPDQAPPPAATAPAGPTTSAERIHSADVLRGMALLGILVVNMQLFSQPVTLIAIGDDLWTRPADLWAMGLIQFFATGKFYTLFSFLFGWGFGVLVERVEAKGLRSASLYRRRLLILALVGIVHVTLLWSGDVLLIYALFGFVLPWFRRRSDRALRRWIVVLVLLPIVLSGALFALESMARMAPEGTAALTAQQTEQEAWFRSMGDQAMMIYAGSAFGPMVGQRILDYTISFLGWVVLSGSGFTILGMFLLGLYAARQGWLHTPTAHQDLWRRVVAWAVPTGVVANLAFVWGAAGRDGLATTARTLVGHWGATIGALAFFAAYAAITLLCLRGPRIRERLVGSLAPVGRMALTNYLLQSLIATTIFYGYGLALYGRIGVPEGLALAVGIFAFQVWLSRIWLERYRFGPAEWAWRALTYGTRPPLRR